MLPRMFLIAAVYPGARLYLMEPVSGTDDISVGAGARYIGSMHKGLTARWERQRLPKVIGSPTLNGVSG